MKNKMEIERKFLINEANLSKAENLRLFDIESTYLDTTLLTAHGANLGISFDNVDGPFEVRVSRTKSADSLVYELVVKVGEKALSRDESIHEIDEAQYNKVVKAFGKSRVNKKRFKFEYLRNTFELDLFPDSSMLLEIELDSESQLFVLPPFVSVVKEVTGDPKFYNSVIAKPL